LRRTEKLRRAWLTTVVAASLALSVGVRGDDFVVDRFGDYLDSLRQQTGIPGLAAALVGTNDIVWERAFGRQNLETAVLAKPDTPFHLDGATQIFTAAMVLRCVEEGLLSLDDRVSKFRANSPDANATLGQLLAHVSETPGGLVFNYRPERLEPLWPAVRACEGGSFRKTLANILERFALFDSVPGPDAPALVPPAEGIPSPESAARYSQTLGRLATPYAVDSQGRAVPSQYSSTTLTPSTGMISTVRDIARFDLALRNGAIIRLDTLTGAWEPPMGSRGRLPHGYGWFVQSYNGMPVVWQFGAGDNGSSSLVVTLPARNLTLVLLANSNGLAKPSTLAQGDLTASAFGRLFLGLFAR
jgi:CubicO group peptidase (beta-lactamase class C family)